MKEKVPPKSSETTEAYQGLIQNQKSEQKSEEASPCNLASSDTNIRFSLASNTNTDLTLQITLTSLD